MHLLILLAQLALVAAKPTFAPIPSALLTNITSQSGAPANYRSWCRTDPDWYTGGGAVLDSISCQDAVNTLLLNDVATFRDRSFTFSTAGPDSSTSRKVPRRYVSGSCVVSIWMREMIIGNDDEIEEAAPQGLQHIDTASFRDLVKLAYQVFDDCVIGMHEDSPSPGWIPGGEATSIFVGFWGLDSDWDRRLLGHMQTVAPPGIARLNGTLGTV